MDRYQVILSLGFGLICFALGYGVRAVISLHRRAKFMHERAELFDKQQVGASLVREMSRGQTEPAETPDLKQL
jgi:hypothetical protein